MLASMVGDSQRGAQSEADLTVDFLPFFIFSVFTREPQTKHGRRGEEAWAENAGCRSRGQFLPRRLCAPSVSPGREQGVPDPVAKLEAKWQEREAEKLRRREAAAAVSDPAENAHVFWQVRLVGAWGRMCRFAQFWVVVARY